MMNDNDICLRDVYNSECFKEKIKYDKRKLHHRYMIGISTGIMAILVIQMTYNNNDFTNKFSFASTITSIILSVIAIIISISGEAKSENVQNNLISASTKLDKTSSKVKNMNDVSFSNLDENMKKVSELKNGLIEITRALQTLDTKIDENHTATNKIMETISGSHENVVSAKHIFSNDQILQIYEISKTIFNDNYRFIIDRSLEYILIIKLKCKETIGFNELVNYVQKQATLPEEAAGSIYGDLFLFIKIDPNRDEILNKLLEVVGTSKRIGDMSEQDMITFHSEYKKESQ